MLAVVGLCALVLLRLPAGRANAAAVAAATRLRRSLESGKLVASSSSSSRAGRRRARVVRCGAAQLLPAANCFSAPNSLTATEILLRLFSRRLIRLVFCCAERSLLRCGGARKSVVVGVFSRRREECVAACAVRLALAASESVPVCCSAAALLRLHLSMHLRSHLAIRLYANCGELTSPQLYFLVCCALKVLQRAEKHTHTGKCSPPCCLRREREFASLCALRGSAQVVRCS